MNTDAKKYSQSIVMSETIKQSTFRSTKIRDYRALLAMTDRIFELRD